jgi:hypothetical protein
MPTSATPISPASARPGYQAPKTRAAAPEPLMDRATGETKPAELAASPHRLSGPSVVAHGPSPQDAYDHVYPAHRTSDGGGSRTANNGLTFAQVKGYGWTILGRIRTAYLQLRGRS